MRDYQLRWMKIVLIFTISGSMFSCGLLQEVEPDEQPSLNRESLSFSFEQNETFECGEMVRKEGMRVGITSAENPDCVNSLGAICQTLTADSYGRLLLTKGTFLKIDFAPLNAKGVSFSYYGSEFSGDCTGSGCLNIRAYDQDGALMDSTRYAPITIPGMSGFVGDEPRFPGVAYVLIPGCDNALGRFNVTVFK